MQTKVENELKVKGKKKKEKKNSKSPDLCTESTHFKINKKVFIF